MKQEILLGDEAAGSGAIQAGLSAGYSYSGSPASEIAEYLLKKSEDPQVLRDRHLGGTWLLLLLNLNSLINRIQFRR